jgi:hypothetical protein
MPHCKEALIKPNVHFFLDIYTQTEDESQREALTRLEKYAGVELPANSSPDQLSL